MGVQVRKRILVADDALPMRIMLQDVLSEAGFEVITARDGEEAWRIFDEERSSFDLLILDLLMPVMSGFEILEKLQAGSHQHKVLVITGIFKSDKEIQRLKDLGACGYITKTALVDEILFRVNQVFHLGQENTRRHPRLLMSVPVVYQVRGEQFSNYTSNFSTGGAFIRTIDPAPPNERIDLSFQIPNEQLTVKTGCRVVWINEYETYRRKSSLPGMGVEFLDMDPSVKKSLDQFIQEKLGTETVWLR